MKALSHSFASRAATPWREPLRCCAPAEEELCASGASASGSRARRALRFPKTLKLLRRADFQRVYQQGRRHFAARMTVFYRRRETEGGPRVGLTVGRMLGGAVERNRIKRRLREAVRYNLAALPLAVDVVINSKKSARAAEFNALKAEVAVAFEKIRATFDVRPSTKESK